MSKKTRILDFYASKAWAIQESSLHEMHQIYQAAIDRKLDGKELDIDALAAKIGKPLDNTRAVTVRDGVAIVPVSGPIFRYANIFTEISGATSVDVLATDFRQALDDRSIRAIILEINSPGGEVDGTSELAQHIFEARGLKPIIAYVSHLGASAAYWLASACDEVVANDTASLGSIGVVGSVFIDKNPRRIQFVSSQSPNKRPNPETEGGRSQIQSHIDDLAQVFVNTVARNRDMTAEEVIEAGGAGGLRVGQLAVDAGLADRVGTLEALIAELSDSSKTFTPPRAQNLNKPSVLQDGSGSETLKPGVEKMADKENDKETEGAEVDQAKLDKTIGERISAFFTEKFGASSPPAKDAAPIVDNAAVEQAKAEATAAKQEAEEAKREATEAKLQVAKIQKESREARFKTLAKDWIGETAHHVAVLEQLAQLEGGEESALFQGYVKQQKAAVEQTNPALFGEIGSSAPAEGSASADIDAQAKKLASESGGKLTYQQAYDQIYAGNADLRSRVDAEERRSVN